MTEFPAAPHGGALIDRTVSEPELAALTRGARPVALAHDDLINLANLGCGCYSPLAGFMTEEFHSRVVGEARLPSGESWTIPVLLHVDAVEAGGVAPGQVLALTDAGGVTLGALEVESTFEIDAEAHSAAIFGTTSAEHPGVQHVAAKPPLCAGGTLHVSAAHLETFRHQRTPAELRRWLVETGKTGCTAFSTRNVCHLGHEFLHRLALEKTDLLGINVITGAQVKGSFLSDVVFDTYEHLIETSHPRHRVFLNNLRLPPIYAGPREAFLQATVLQNLGFTHFIVGRDHAGIGSFYSKYAAQEIFQELTDLTIEILAIPEPRHCHICGTVTNADTCSHGGDDVMGLNGREVRRYLLERRYDELDSILSPELQRIVIDMFEQRVDLGGDELALNEARAIFYD